jgi:hypothetical protein
MKNMNLFYFMGGRKMPSIRNGFRFITEGGGQELNKLIK